MSDSAAFGFGKFIPGFDFLHQLGQAGASSGGVPPLSHWVAPTVSVEEISKRIEELKAVQFWLEQNSRALSATVQALEVQKMTLHTLQGMNVSMADLAKSFSGPGAAMQAAAAPAAGAHADWPMSSEGAKSRKKSAAAAKPERGQAEDHMAAAAQAASKPETAGKADAGKGAAAGMGDPMLWWGALSQQFQQIAGQALQDPAQQQAMAKATHMATDFTKAAMQAAGEMARKATEGVKSAASAAAPGRSAGRPAARTAAPAAAAPGSAPKAKPQPAAKRPAAAKKAAVRKPATPAAKPAASTKSTAGRR